MKGCVERPAALVVSRDVKIRRLDHEIIDMIDLIPFPDPIKWLFDPDRPFLVRYHNMCLLISTCDIR